MSYQVVCPLVNFNVAPNLPHDACQLGKEETLRILENRWEQIRQGIALINGVRLRPTSKNEIKELGFYQIRFERLSSVRFALEKKRVRPPFGDVIRRDIRNTILALRLTKEGYFSAPFVLEIERRRDDSSRQHYSVERERINYRGGMFLVGFNYTLNYDEIPKLNHLLRKLQRADFDDCALRLGCSRFQRSYEEDNLQDQLIDLMIAFEALFLKGEKTWEKGKRISTKCSQLLGKSEEDREHIQWLLETAYKKRNMIVHGSIDEDLEEPTDIDGLIIRVRNLLRQSIEAFLRTAKLR